MSARTAPADLLFVATSGGLTALRADTGQATLPKPARLATFDWTRVVSVNPDGTGNGTRLITQEPRSGQILAGGDLRDRLEPRVVSPDGRLVALATPASGTGRTRTTLVVADSGGERARLDLEGNLEPEAFSSTGTKLFVLDHRPPTKPDRYRVRVVDLKTGRIEPLQTKQKVPVPPGAEEEMRGQGRQAVFDPTRNMLFTLYTHQPDHEHTRDLIAGGARKDAPHVHAFVHSLHLDEGWAFCVDLPAPFGEGSPAGHVITQASSGGRLFVIDAGTGKVAHIDPSGLVVDRVATYREAAPASSNGPSTDASARATRSGGLVVGCGSLVVSTEPKREIRLAGPVRGLALSGQNTVWVGQDDAVALFDLATGEERARVAVAGLIGLRHVAPAA